MAQRLPVRLDDGVRALSQLDDEIQHRGALLIEPGGPPVLGDRLAEAGVAGELAYRGAMGRQAVMAVIDRGDDDGDDDEKDDIDEEDFLHCMILDATDHSAGNDGGLLI